MNMLKNLALAFSLAAAVGALSSPAFAETDKGRITYKPAESVEIAVSKIQLAIDAIAKGASADEIDDLIKNAADFSKEINANDKVDRARTKATAKLRGIRAKVKSGATAEAEQELKGVLAEFSHLKDLI